MTKVSASTLARRAAKTKNPALAKKLRAQAAKMRREAREAKRAVSYGAALPKEKRKAKKRRAMTGLPDRNSIVKTLKGIVSAGERAAAQQLNQAFYGDTDTANDNAARAASVDHIPLTNAPGHGEVVGGYLASLAANLAKMARKKGGVDAIQSQLMLLEAQTRHDAKFNVNQLVQKAAQSANENWRTNIVTGFMARMQGLEQMHRGLPDNVIVDGVTLARVVDALAMAGYTAGGNR